MELGRIRADNLPHGLPRNAQLPADLLNRLLLNEKRPANLGDRFLNQHSNLGRLRLRRSMWTLSPGVPIGCKSPPSVVLIPCKFTSDLPPARPSGTRIRMVSPKSPLIR